jgi:hypothetical protein
MLTANAAEVGPGVVEKSGSWSGTAFYNYPMNSIHAWTAGPHEAILWVALKRGSGVRQTIAALDRWSRFPHTKSAR